MMFNDTHFKINSYYRIFYQVIKDKLKYINSNYYDSLYNIKRILEKKKKMKMNQKSQKFQKPEK